VVTKAYGAYAGDKPLKPIDIERRQLGPYDVQIGIAYCGVCHSALHQVRSEWGDTIYPCVPDHDIVGHVSAVGNEAMKFKVGDTVSVSRIVDPCQRCLSCNDGLEQYCEHGFTGTYNCRTPDAPGHTLSAYSQQIVVKESSRASQRSSRRTPRSS
jgi:alcohol dehydrogenase (NADP+)